MAAYPAVDEIVKAAIPAWKKLHPAVDVQVASRQFSDRHTAMTTALSTSFYLPDVMALEVGYVGRFAQGGGLEDLSQPAYNMQQFRSRFVPYAYDQATARNGKVVAVPTDIGPGTLLYRADILAKAHVSQAELPCDLIEAVRMDGCSEIGIYWRIVGPLLKPAMGTLGLITFIASWNKFIGPLIVMRSPEMYTLPLALRSLQSPVNSEWGALMTGSTIATLPLVVLFVMSSRQLISGLTTGAVK
ncbi:MAG: extracellular solute-binding protein [Rhodoferax sp.]